MVATRSVSLVILKPMARVGKDETQALVRFRMTYILSKQPMILWEELCASSASYDMLLQF